MNQCNFKTMSLKQVLQETAAVMLGNGRNRLGRQRSQQNLLHWKVAEIHTQSREPAFW
jgi:hypothetical protein